jgi:hypothetical protein
MGWQTVEHWQAQAEIGVLDLWLKRIDDVFAHAWRVEWGQRGHGRKGASFVGDDRERLARQELQRRKDKVPRTWQRVD